MLNDQKVSSTASTGRELYRVGGQYMTVGGLRVAWITEADTDREGFAIGTIEGREDIFGWRQRDGSVSWIQPAHLGNLPRLICSALKGMALRHPPVPLNAVDPSENRAIGGLEAATLAGLFVSAQREAGRNRREAYERIMRKVEEAEEKALAALTHSAGPQTSLVLNDAWLQGLISRLREEAIGGEDVLQKSNKAEKVSEIKGSGDEGPDSTYVVRHGEPWVGFDLDGTLAHYDGWRGVEHIGKPIPAMVALVKFMISQNIQVKVFTARVSVSMDADAAAKAIEDWCSRHIGFVLPITCVKDMNCVAIFDDRVIRVETNKGLAFGWCVAQGWLHKELRDNDVKINYEGLSTAIAMADARRD